MKKFKVNGEDYEMVENIDEMLLSQLIILEEELPTFNDLTPTQVVLRMVEILSNQDKNSLLEIDIQTLNDLGTIISNIDYSNIQPEIKSHVVIGDIDYVFKNDMNKLSAGENISIEILQKNAVNNLESSFDLLSILLRPGRKVVDKETKQEIWVQDPFDASNLDYRKELFKKTLKAKEGVGVLRFFLTGRQTSITNTKSSSEEKHQLKKKGSVSPKKSQKN